MDVTARHYETGRWMHLTIRGGAIAEVGPADGPGEAGPGDDWVAPAFWDIQTNGRWGVSYSAPTLTVDQVAEIVRVQAELGTARLCPTLITASPDDLLHGVRTIARACDADPEVGSRVAGIHLE